LLQHFFKEGINENKGDCHHCRIISFLRCLYWKEPFGSSADRDNASKPYPINAYDYYY